MAMKDDNIFLEEYGTKISYVIDKLYNLLELNKHNAT